MIGRWKTLLIVVALLGSASGCQRPESSGSATTATTATTTPSTAAEISVKPGINAPYKDPNLDVDEWIDQFERESREVYQARNEILQAVGVEPGQTVADIGAGTGLFTMLFAGATGPTGCVYAVDIAPKFIKHIDDRARRSGHTNIQTVRCKEDSVELPPGAVDVAFICDTYHHFEYPRSSTTSLYRAMRPGGRVVIVDFDRFDGVSRDWILGHVRIGKEDVIREVVSCGFELVSDGIEIEALKENYVVVFRKPVSQ